MRKKDGISAMKTVFVSRAQDSRATWRPTVYLHLLGCLMVYSVRGGNMTHRIITTLHFYVEELISTFNSLFF